MDTNGEYENMIGTIVYRQGCSTLPGAVLYPHL